MAPTLHLEESEEFFKNDRDGTRKEIEVVEPVHPAPPHRVHCRLACPLANRCQPASGSTPARPLGRSQSHRRAASARAAGQVCRGIALPRYVGLCPGRYSCHSSRSYDRLVPARRNGLQPPGSNLSPHLALSLDPTRHSLVRSGRPCRYLSY